MSRMEMYCDVLSETFPLQKEVLMGQLQSFIDRHGRWRRYFETQMTPDEEGKLRQGLREHRVGLFAWLLACGAISPGTLEEAAFSAGSDTICVGSEQQDCR